MMAGGTLHSHRIDVFTLHCVALMCLHCNVLHWCVYIALCCKASSSTPPCASPFAKNKRKQGKLGATCRTKYHTVGNNNHPP